MGHRSTLLEIYQRLYECYGPQHWWPADSPFEVMVGAILTQNTSWSNVEKAINNLKEADALNVHTLIELPEENLAKLIRPSGYFNIKSKRLKHFVHWFEAEGRFNGLKELDDQTLRNQLLEVNGIGPETADDILLYAFERPVFVIDSYTRRLLRVFNLISELKLRGKKIRCYDPFMADEGYEKYNLEKISLKEALNLGKKIIIAVDHDEFINIDFEKVIRLNEL